MNIEVSIGEIVDKLTILRIKKNNITDEGKLFNVITEYDYLYDVVFNQLKIESDDYMNNSSVVCLSFVVVADTKLTQCDTMFQLGVNSYLVNATNVKFTWTLAAETQVV